MNQLAVLALSVQPRDTVLEFMAKMLPGAQAGNQRAWSDKTPKEDLIKMAANVEGAKVVKGPTNWDICAFILQHVKTLLAPVAPLTPMDALTQIEPEADELLTRLEAQTASEAEAQRAAKIKAEVQAAETRLKAVHTDALKAAAARLKEAHEEAMRNADQTASATLAAAKRESRAAITEATESAVKAAEQAKAVQAAADLRVKDAQAKADRAGKQVNAAREAAIATAKAVKEAALAQVEAARADAAAAASERAKAAEAEAATHAELQQATVQLREELSEARTAAEAARAKAAEAATAVSKHAELQESHAIATVQLVEELAAAERDRDQASARAHTEAAVAMELKLKLRSVQARLAKINTLAAALYPTIKESIRYMDGILTDDVTDVNALKDKWTSTRDTIRQKIEEAQFSGGGAASPTKVKGDLAPRWAPLRF
jgi:chromosome segregation ATPase